MLYIGKNTHLILGVLILVFEVLSYALPDPNICRVCCLIGECLKVL